MQNSLVEPSKAQSPSPAPESQDHTAPQRPSLDTAQLPPRLPQGARSSTRDPKSSIASNLASARGIPAGQQRRGAPISPTVSAQHAGGTFGKVVSGEAESKTMRHEKPHRDGSSRPSRLQDVMTENTDDDTTPDVKDGRAGPTRDDAFQRFYATFEGLMSKISAPLAFPGLPLSPPTKQTSMKPVEAPAKPVSEVEPDLNRIISRAALRSIAGSGDPNPNESFYLVPTTGGTVSYAQILSREQEAAAAVAAKHHRRNFSANSENDLEDFVDARETPGSPELQRTMSAAPRRKENANAAKPSASGQKTTEELQIENMTLKDLLDRTSNRLQMWEVNAQSSSAALQQSLRSVHGPRSLSPAGRVPQPATNVDATTSDDHAATATPDHMRIKELEETVQKREAEMKKTARENEKLKEVVGRYRDKWEKLKEAAKSRREGTKADVEVEG